MEIKWWIGKVAVLSDPEQRGRIKVRINGIHHDGGLLKGNKTVDESSGIGLKDDDLPWALCLMPFTYSGTVPPPQIPLNAWVLGISLDGDAYQELICLGRLSMNMNQEALCQGGVLGGGQETSITTSLIDTILKAYGGSGLSNSKESSSLGSGGSKTYNASQTVLNNYYNALNNTNSNDIAASNLAKALEDLRTNNKDIYNKFINSSGISINDNVSISKAMENETIKNALLKSWYNFNLEKTNDPVIAALSYSEGYGTVVTGYNSTLGTKVSSVISQVGSMNEPTYSCFVNNLSKLSDSSYRNIATKFIQSFGEKNLLAVKSQCGDDITNMNDVVLNSDSINNASVINNENVQIDLNNFNTSETTVSMYDVSNLDTITNSLNSEIVSTAEDIISSAENSSIINNINTTNKNDILSHITNTSTNVDIIQNTSIISNSDIASTSKRGITECSKNGAIWYSSNDYVISLGFNEIVFPCNENKLLTQFINTGEYKHTGIDIGAKEYDYIYAIADGEITKTFKEANCILLKCSNGISFRYAHCNSTILDNTSKENLKVKCGDIIGKVGNYFSIREIEPHLHIDIFANGIVSSKTYEYNGKIYQDPQEIFEKSGFIFS